MNQVLYIITHYFWMIINILNTILLVLAFVKYKKYRKDNFMLHYAWYWLAFFLYIIGLGIYVSFDFVSNREEIKHPLFFEIMFTYLLLFPTPIFYVASFWRFTFNESELIFVKLNGKKIIKKIDDLDCANTHIVYSENLTDFNSHYIFVFNDGIKIKVMFDVLIGYDRKKWLKLDEILKKKKIK